MLKNHACNRREDRSDHRRAEELFSEDKPVSPRRKRAGIPETRLQGWHISPGKMDLASRLYGCLLVFYFSPLVHGDEGKLKGVIPDY